MSSAKKLARSAATSCRRAKVRLVLQVWSLLIPGLAFALPGTTSEFPPHLGELDAPASVLLPSAEVHIPLRTYHGLPVVSVTISGRGPYDMILDTGAGVTLLDEAIASSLRLPEAGDARVGDSVIPTAIHVKKRSVAVLDIGGARFVDFTCASWDRPSQRSPGGPVGVLGMPLFQSILLTIDAAKNQIVLAQTRLPEPREPGTIPYVPSPGGTIQIPVVVSGVTLDADLDSGSASGLSIPRTFADRIPLESSPVMIGKGRTVNGEFEIRRAMARGPVEVAGQLASGREIFFNDYLPVANFGFGRMRDFAISIDQRRREVRFQPRLAPKQPVADPSTSVGCAGADLSTLVGRFGERNITLENGVLYLRRAGGLKLRMRCLGKDMLGLDEIPDARISAVRDKTGHVTELRVRTPDGNWETSMKTVQ